MMTDMRARLEALAAGPKPWRVTTRYDDGSERTLDQPWQKSAENFAARERERIGRDLIDPETGKTVRAVEVTITHIGKAAS